MRLQLLLPKVEPKEITEPGECVYAGCGSKRVQMHQAVEKGLRDTMHKQGEVHRYRCLECGRTFRVYPKGVSKAHTSDRVRGLAVMLYLLGLYDASGLAGIGKNGACLSQKRKFTTRCRRSPDGSQI